MTMSNEKFKGWEPLVGQIKENGFNWKSDPVGGGVVDVRFYGGNAIDLAKAMISVLPSILRDALDVLSFKKWISIRRIAEMEVKWRRGESQIEIAGYKFTVSVRRNTIKLMHQVKDKTEAEEVVDALRAVYGDGVYTYVNRGGKYLLVRIPMYVFEKYGDIKAQVIEVLRKKLERTKDERKKQIITKHLTRLTHKEDSRSELSQGLCPTQLKWFSQRPWAKV